MKNNELENELEKISNLGIKLLNSARNNGVAIPEKHSDKNQHYFHGFAWYATYFKAIETAYKWIKSLNENGLLTEYEIEIAKVGISEYCLQILHGIPMSQSEIIRPDEIFIDENLIEEFKKISQTIINESKSETKQKLCEIIKNNTNNGIFPNIGLDQTNEQIRQEFAKFTNEKIIPNAQKWHLNDELIPISIIDEMSELGVFGLTIPEEYGGLGLSKTAMCIVSEELSRGWIGTGSLGTRADIAAELILVGGNEDQKKKFLPKIAKGKILPTAVFSEPDIGSDLAHLKTRAILNGNNYEVIGNKTWITHGSRANLMTMLVRTKKDIDDHNGLSILLAEKTSGNQDDPFPDENIKGGEIDVIGYRGMKEYDIAFEGFKVPSDHLLGDTEGQGFRQLMSTFESARIQTAARALGVSQNACDLALQYSQERSQFGKELINFSRISEKISAMYAETMIARQLTLYAAKIKDTGQRCDMEAGMAKLLAARTAWASADSALQIHGGIGFASETPISRVLADSRILSIFEGTAEIQAQVIAKRLFESNNR